MQKAEPFCKRIAPRMWNKSCPSSAVKFPSRSLPALSTALEEWADQSALVGMYAGLATLQARREGRQEARKFKPVPFCSKAWALSHSSITNSACSYSSKMHMSNILFCLYFFFPSLERVQQANVTLPWFRLCKVCLPRLKGISYILPPPGFAGFEKGWARQGKN